MACLQGKKNTALLCTTSPQRGIGEWRHTITWRYVRVYCELPNKQRIRRPIARTCINIMLCWNVVDKDRAAEQISTSKFLIANFMGWSKWSLIWEIQLPVFCVHYSIYHRFFTLISFWPTAKDLYTAAWPLHGIIWAVAGYPRHSRSRIMQSISYARITWLSHGGNAKCSYNSLCNRGSCYHV